MPDSAGGWLVVTGTLEEAAATAASYTGAHLTRVLAPRLEGAKTPGVMAIGPTVPILFRDSGSLKRVETEEALTCEVGPFARSRTGDETPRKQAAFVERSKWAILA